LAPERWKRTGVFLLGPLNDIKSAVAAHVYFGIAFWPVKLVAITELICNKYYFVIGFFKCFEIVFVH
jgi:hypothetical protein